MRSKACDFDCDSIWNKNAIDLFRCTGIRRSKYPGWGVRVYANGLYSPSMAQISLVSTSCRNIARFVNGILRTSNSFP